MRVRGPWGARTVQAPATPGQLHGDRGPRVGCKTIPFPAGHSDRSEGRGPGAGGGVEEVRAQEPDHLSDNDPEREGALSCPLDPRPERRGPNSEGGMLISEERGHPKTFSVLVPSGQGAREARSKKESCPPREGINPSSSSGCWERGPRGHAGRHRRSSSMEGSPTLASGPFRLPSHPLLRRLAWELLRTGPAG